MCTLQPRLRAMPSVSTSMRTKVEHRAAPVKLFALAQEPTGPEPMVRQAGASGPAQAGLHLEIAFP